MNTRNNELIDNPSTRCPCILVLDTSGSMSGQPIDELNAGLSAFLQAVQDDECASWSVELSVISAGSPVREILPFTVAANIHHIEPLSASGSTPLGEAVNLALRRLDERKNAYKQAGVPYYQPWMVLISDGAPTDSWNTAAQCARDLASNRRLVSLPVGVQGADMGTLGAFSNKPALPLKGLQFRDFFEWLSQSMSRVSSSNSSASTVNLPPANSWASI